MPANANTAVETAPAADLVTCLVVAAGDNRITKDRDFENNRDNHYAKGDTFQTTQAIALDLEQAGLVHIQ